MDKASHLGVVLDLSPSQWHSATPDLPPPLSLSSFLSQVLAFLNMHLACKDENTLSVHGAFPGKSVLLYSTSTPVSDEIVGHVDANTYKPFKKIDTAVIKTIMNEFEKLSVSEEEYINRETNSSSSDNTGREESTLLPDPRILILSVSPDQPSSYIPIMNSIFSAQKLRVTIDVCKLSPPESVFLQQAAHLTGGSYIFLERPDALLQYMTDKVDFRAACFCHKKIVDIGFVCSVCLSIFCQPVPVCSTCRTKFPIKTLQRLNASKPPAPTVAVRPTTPAPASRSISTPSGASRGGVGNGIASSPSRNGVSITKGP
ncbi:hypothetical protein NLI96_g7158 [Meripilus lineatus]|uniref:General transcription and DNA repair factor IIH subunit TFB4 n=1 Tax=Meripilus lineatus TaxID=2056292 RepID=A0AAD5YCB3_9APHY|nr:hypothetical protein NLI96_g7158 [Physisporinus lineatus]